MTPLDVLLALTTPLLLASSALPRRTRAVGVAASAAVSAALVLTALVLDRVRWPTAVLAAAAVLALAVALARLRPPRRPRRRAATVLARLGGATAGTLAVLLALGATGANWALPRFSLPAPSGPHAVAETTLQWERPHPGPSPRTIVGRLWYPTVQRPDPGGVAYLGRDAGESTIVAAALAEDFGAPAFLFDEVARGRVPAAADAMPAPGRWPVIVLSPGLGGVRAQNTSLAMELASHGYAVLAIDHPGDSSATVLEDGTIVRSNLADDPATADSLIGEWALRRAADLSSALDELERIAEGARTDAAGRRLAGALDPARAIAAGHSLGGASAILAAGLDPRFAAAVDLDGYPWLAETLGALPPVLALVAGEGTGDAEADDRYRAALDAVLAASSDPVRVEVAGAAHLSFTDAPAYLPPLPELVGERGRGGASAESAEAILAFAARVLHG